MNTLIVFICKLLDCAFSTMKNILLYKNKHLFSAIVCTISTYFYLTMMVQLTKDSSELAKVVICLATFLGTYIPSKFFHVLEKEKLYIYDITTCDFKSGQKFADNIRKLNLPIKTYVAYTTNRKDVNELKKILCCKIYCDTKEQSKQIIDFMPKNFNYNILIPHK